MSAPAPFTHDAPAARVIFGEGERARLAPEVERLGVGRAFLIAPPRLADEGAALLGERAAGVHTGAVMHVPAANVREAAAAAARARADGIVALGGGSAVGLAKALAFETGWPVVAVPTTYAGSEATSIWGVTEGGVKRTGRDARVRPRTIIYDPELLRSLPAGVAGPSGLNAIAHAVEALYARAADPITLLFAEESVRAIGEHLPRLVARGAAPGGERGGRDDGADRAGVLYGAWLAGMCLDRAAMGVHHKLCHVLGGTFGLPHAGVHAVMIAHAAAFNRDAAPEAMRRLGAALGAKDAVAALAGLAARAGAPASLAALGMAEGDLDRAAALATERPYDNPRPVDRRAIRSLLADAFAGVNPAARGAGA